MPGDQKHSLKLNDSENNADDTEEHGRGRFELRIQQLSGERVQSLCTQRNLKLIWYLIPQEDIMEHFKMTNETSWQPAPRSSGASYCEPAHRGESTLPHWPRDEAPGGGVATASMTHCCLPREDNRGDALTPLGWSWWRGSNLHHVV
ncbi:unnamed protein product [Arctogadus glacialis]